MAAAIGHSVDIPIVIRALASDLRNYVPGTILNFNEDFLLSLDAGTDHHDPAKVVKSYHCQWWSAREAPPTEDLLNAHNIREYLKHHREVSELPESDPPLLAKPSYTWSRGVTVGSLPPKIDCDRCRLYRSVAIGALDDLRDLRHHAHALEVCYVANSAATSRRAADLYQLYEAAVLKDDTPAPSKRVKRNPTVASNQIRTTAEEELSRLRTLPNLKWTAGVALSPQEVLETLKPHRHEGRIHSGYVNSLASGTWGEDSIADVSPFPDDDDCYSDANNSAPDIPGLSPHQFPIHFTLPPLRDFHGDAPRLGPSSVDSALAKSLHVHFDVPDAPPLRVLPTRPVSDDHSIISISSDSDEAGPDSDCSVGPDDAFGLDQSKPASGSSSASGSVSDSTSDNSPEAAPSDAFPDPTSVPPAAEVPHCESSSASDTESDSMCEVTATEAAAALEDVDADIGVGGMVLAAILSGQFAVETDPPPANRVPDSRVAGPFTADWFTPFNLDSLCDSSDDSDND